MSQIRDMRFRDALNPMLGSPTKLGLLRTLFASPSRSWTGRELAKAAGVSAAQAARDLRDLSETSLVTRTVVGKSYSWRLNSAHVLGPALTGLFAHEASLRSELLTDLSEGLRSANLESARLFGSISRGDERADSDLDVYLEVRSSRDKSRAEEAIDRLRSRLWDRFGNPISVLIYTRAEARHPRNPSLLRTIEEEGLDLLREG